MQLVGALVAAAVGLATIGKGMVDAHAAAIKECREQIAAAEQFYLKASERALAIRFPSAAAAAAPLVPDLLATSFEEVVSRQPVAFDAPFLRGDLATEGQQRLCAARSFAIAEHYAAADPETKTRFGATEARIGERDGHPWRKCERILATAGREGVKQQQEVAPTPPAIAAAPPVAAAASGPTPAAATPGKPPGSPASPGGAPARPGPVNVTVTNTASARSAAINLLPPNTAIGWQVDSFSCQASGEAGQKIAAQAGGLLARLSDARQRVGGEVLGAVRVQALPRQLAGNVIYYDANEFGFASALKAVLAENGLAYRIEPNPETPTRWSVSLFACPPAPPAAPPAPAPAPAPASSPPAAAAAKSFEVLFAAKDLRIDAAGQQVIAAAATAALEGHARQIVLVSYNTGDAASLVKSADMRLRASAVKKALEKRLPGGPPVILTPRVTTPVVRPDTRWVEIKLLF